MKKIMIFAAMAAMFSLASCQKDEVVANNEAKESPVFTASINAGTTKTTVDVSNGKIAWENTDEITITDNGGTSAVYEIGSLDGTTGKATFTPKSGQPELGDGPYTATYGSAPATYQTYSATAGKLYMTAPATSNNSFTFTVLCGLMKLNLSKSGETITHIAVTGTPTGGTKKTYTMYCPGGVDISSGKDFFIALPAGSYDKIEVYKHDATNGFMVCSLNTSPSSIAVSANHIKPVNASDSKIIFSECQNLPGVFSVSNNNGTTIKQIRFSKGNLTYNVSTTTWGFYELQYNCATAYDANLISLFTWGYDATKSIVPNGAESDNVSTTSGNLSQEQDWGYTIGDGNTWRTLTSAEWQYLFKSRKMSNNGTKSENLTSSGITVESVTFKGVVLFPDDFTEQDTWKTKYTTWKALNDAGLVFLPIAGHREADQLKTLNNGFYWSSSVKDESNANSLLFDKNNCLPEGYTKRNWGASVRLISDIK